MPMLCSTDTLLFLLTTNSSGIWLRSSDRECDCCSSFGVWTRYSCNWSPFLVSVFMGHTAPTVSWLRCNRVDIFQPACCLLVLYYQDQHIKKKKSHFLTRSLQIQLQHLINRLVVLANGATLLTNQTCSFDRQSKT